MTGRYWIVWGYSDGCGHTPGSDSYSTREERQRILDDKTLWRQHCFPSDTFETDAKGDVI